MFLRNLTDEKLIYREEFAPLVLEPKSDTYLFVVDENLIDRVVANFPKKVIKVHYSERISEGTGEANESIVEVKQVEEIIVEEVEELKEDIKEEVIEKITKEDAKVQVKEEKKVVEIVLPKNKTTSSKNKK